MKRRELLAVAVGTAFAGCSAGASDGSETAAKSPATRLEVESRTEREYELTFELRELQRGTVVYEDARTVGPGDSFSLDSKFEPDAEYRFVVRRAGEKLLNFSIYPYEGYVVTVRPGPTVDISREVAV